MPTQPDLPPHLLQNPFSIAQARAAGIEPERLRTRLLQRPFYGIRSRGLDLDLTLDRCRGYAARMSPEGVFSHFTSARLWEMPLPLAAPDELHVTVPVGTRAAAGRGVHGHQQRLAAVERGSHLGVPLASPAATWAQLAEHLTVEDLIAAAEHIITGNPYEQRLPLAEVADLQAAIELRTSGPGHRRRVAAMKEVREGAFSRPESLVRLLLVRCGIPQPLINADVYSATGKFVAMPDLQWPEFRVALEYQGDGHRETRRFRRDIARLERLADEDWLVVQVSAAELFGDPLVVVERVARRLASAGWPGRIHLRHLTTFTP
jgi:hypothetical protein